MYKTGQSSIKPGSPSTHAQGVIIFSGGRMGDVGFALAKGNQWLLAQKITEFYQQHFPDCFYLELTRTGRQGEEDYIHASGRLGRRNKIFP